MKNKVRSFGIFGKVFFYTCLIIIFIVGIFFALFYERIQSTVTITQQQQLGNVFHPLLESLQDKTDEETIEIAKAFHAENRSFQFCFENANGSVLYQTDGFSKPEAGLPFDSPLYSGALFEQGRYKFATIDGGTGRQSAILALSVNDKKFYISGFSLTSSVFDEIVGEAIIAFSLILFVSLIAAAVFARRIAKPIRRLTTNTRMMAEFEDAPDFPDRSDEIGQLAKDVYLMHQNLKDSIGQLEEEIKREREMEENQRYFFSAASHELKTPIAAASAILEGMTEGVIEPEEYPSCLQETLRLMQEQSTLVTEILDIVKMNDHVTTPVFSKFNISHFIHNTLECFYPLFEAKEQILLLDVDDNLVIHSDSHLLAKALTCILHNATQNSPQKATICVATKMKTERCVLSVENSGTHIPEANVSKMFEAFYVEDESRSNTKGRNGLGLTIVRKILTLMEIPYDIQNTKGGVRFSMTLPCS
ncbi:MAG: HAMP domain-containing histidine kinase [Oscillospiraceae bacterium]|nr:HAMP domain-containing histidine kinase [Oscillospiraceae bacterium]